MAGLRNQQPFLPSGLGLNLSHFGFTWTTLFQMCGHKYDRGDVISSLLPKCKLNQYYLFHHILHEKPVMTILRFLKQAEKTMYFMKHVKVWDCYFYYYKTVGKGKMCCLQT